ncbi:Uncharacterised protein [uncultured archaeon]|nr:Uncharacterised protein [uncultured archaeon]
MEIEFKDETIIFNRELTLLDSFVLDFIENLDNVMLKMFLGKLKISDNKVKKYLGDFDES